MVSTRKLRREWAWGRPVGSSWRAPAWTGCRLREIHGQRDGDIRLLTWWGHSQHRPDSYVLV